MLAGMKTAILVEGTERGSEIDSGVRGFFSRQWEFEHLSSGASLINKRTADRALSGINVVIGDYLASAIEERAAFASRMDTQALRLFALKYLTLEKLVRGKRGRNGLAPLVLNGLMVKGEIGDPKSYLPSPSVAETVASYLAARKRASLPAAKSEFEAAYDFAIGVKTETLRELVSHYLRLEYLAWHPGAENALADMVHVKIHDAPSLEAQRQSDAAILEWDLSENEPIDAVAL